MIILIMNDKLAEIQLHVRGLHRSLQRSVKIIRDSIKSTNAPARHHAI